MIPLRRASDKRFVASLLIASAAALATIANFEGTELVAKPDPIGIPTACNGHTKGVVAGMRFTPSECAQLLKEDAGEAGKAIAQCTTVGLTQRQYDALVSFVINVGGRNYCKSTLARKQNAGDCVGAANEFSRWKYAGGREFPGLVKRRAYERAEYLTGCES
jgi:lysozyme